MLKESRAYYISIEFNKEEENSIEILKSTLHLLKGLQDFNAAIVHSIDGEIITYPALLKIEEGSIRIWLKDHLEKIPDEKISNYVKNPREALSDLLITTKYKAIKLLDKKDNQPNKLKEKIDEIIEAEIITAGLDNYGYTIQSTDALNALTRISHGVKLLSHKTSINFQNKDPIVINPNFEYNNTGESLVSENTIKKILTIKKPDLVGKSKWTFIDQKIIEAEITDIEWLTKLRNRDFAISSGDMIEADLRIQTINASDQHKEIHYFIDKVHRIFPPTNNQTYLDFI